VRFEVITAVLGYDAASWVHDSKYFEGLLCIHFRVQQYKQNGQAGKSLVLYRHNSYRWLMFYIDIMVTDS